LKETMYLGHGVARRKLKVAAARQKKNFQERSRCANFQPGDWVWKTDSIMRVGKLHQKNLGPYLVMEKTGPVNYKIQGSPAGRTSTLHVDKLYPYTPRAEEELISWLPVAAPSVDAASQCQESPLSVAACQTELPWPPADAVCPDTSTADSKGSPSRPAKEATVPVVLKPPPTTVPLRRSTRTRPTSQRIRRVTDGTDKRIMACLAETLLRVSSGGLPEKSGGNM